MEFGKSLCWELSCIYRNVWFSIGMKSQNWIINQALEAERKIDKIDSRPATGR